MTIKQQGGVFGRNPTFNDVTIEGTLTFDGDVDINSDLQVDGELIVNRTAAGFGTAIEIKNKGASAGELAIDAGYLTIGKGDVGILFQDGGNAIQPRDVVGLTNSNGLIDLGVTGARFKNLFLAENVVVGSGYGIDFSATAGTGTSELLDDYEEGVYTPALTPGTSGTITLNTANDTLYYTKIGRILTITGRVTLSSVSSPVGTQISVTVPFIISSAAEGVDLASGVTAYYDGSANQQANWRAVPGTNTIIIFMDASTVTASFNFGFSLSFVV